MHMQKYTSVFIKHTLTKCSTSLLPNAYLLLYLIKPYLGAVSVCLGLPKSRYPNIIFTVQTLNFGYKAGLGLKEGNQISHENIVYKAEHPAVCPHGRNYPVASHGGQ